MTAKQESEAKVAALLDQISKLGGSTPVASAKNTALVSLGGHVPMAPPPPPALPGGGGGG